MRVKRFMAPAAVGTLAAGASWAGPDNMWHEGGRGPTCVGTDTAAKTHVQLGIVYVETGNGGIGGAHVAWLRCLD
jgi:hypothetical protein